MVHRVLLAAVLAMAIASSIPSAVASVSPAGEDTLPGARVAIDRYGYVRFAWIARTAGAPSAVRHLAPSDSSITRTAAGAGNYPVDVTAHDVFSTAVITWIHRGPGHATLTGLLTTTYTYITGDARQLSPAGVEVTDWRVVMNPGSGDALIVWTGADGSIGMRRWVWNRYLDTAPGPVTTVAYADAPRDLDVEASSDGRFLIGWTALEGGDRRAYVRPVTDAGPLGPTRAVASPDRGVTDLDLDVDAEGRAVIAWEQTGAGGHRLLERTRAADGGWGSIVALDGNQPEPLDPQVAISDAGTGMLVWRGAAGATQLRRAAVSTTEAPGPRLSVTATPVAEHALGVASEAGVAVLVYSTAAGAVMVRRYARDGSLLVSRRLNAFAGDVSALSVSVAGTGRGVAVWTQMGSPARVESAGA